MIKLISDEVTKLLTKIPLAKNLARKKFISSFLIGMLDSRKVQFQEIAIHMPSTAKVESVERNIQAFFKDFEFDYKQVCLLLVLFLKRGKVKLSIDRTEWDFGAYQCNILMIVAKTDSIGIPLYWDLLDNKSGNSHGDQRIDLLNKVIDMLGKERIELVVGDREFVGISWIKYLKDNNIPYCMRLPKSHLITLKNGDCYSIDELLASSSERYFQDCMVDGVWGNCSMKRLENGDYLFLTGSFPAKALGRLYRNRWCIESLFQSFKGRGFDLESTHLTCSKKLRKLLVFVSIAVAVCVRVGEYYHEKVQSIKIKKHGYKATSFFRKGLSVVRRGLKHPTQAFMNLWVNCLAIFVRWIDIQFAHNQQITKIFG
jgi:hypothetical protein